VKTKKELAVEHPCEDLNRENLTWNDAIDEEEDRMEDVARCAICTGGTKV